MLYFVGAIVTVIRSGRYSDIPYPAVFLLLAIGIHWTRKKSTAAAKVLARPSR